jgi:hypothetical protein
MTNNISSLFDHSEDNFNQSHKFSEFVAHQIGTRILTATRGSNN